jgi:hypothetical protein
LLDDRPFIFLETVKSVNVKGEKEEQEKKEIQSKNVLEKEQNKYVIVN